MSAKVDAQRDPDAERKRDSAQPQEMAKLQEDIEVHSSKHPLAGKEMTGADMIIQVLADEGVDVLFGYSGGAILPTWDALARYNIEQESKRLKPIELVVPA